METEDWERNAKFVLSELGRVADGLESLKAGQSEISWHLQHYNSELRLHIRGVQALERKTDLLERHINNNLKVLDARLVAAELPLKWAMATGNLFKWIIGLGGSAGVLYAFARWAGWA